MMADKKKENKLLKNEKMINYKYNKERLKRELAKSPYNFFDLLHLARLEIEHENYEAAEAPLNKIIGLYPEYFEAYKDRSDVYKALGEQEKMEADLREVEEIKRIRTKNLEKLWEKTKKHKD